MCLKIFTSYAYLHGLQDAAVVRRSNILTLVAEFLRVTPSALLYKTKLLKESCTVFLDPDGTTDDRDDLAKTIRCPSLG